MGLNPSKRYTREIAEKEASNLIADIVEALKRKGVSPEIFLNTLQYFGELSQKMGIAINDCEECRVSYSKGKVEGFCENHQNLRKIFQKKIDKVLRD
jgi:hypothetical protein